MVNCSGQTQAVAKAIEAKEFSKAMSLRDPEFTETYHNFAITSSLTTANRLPADKVRFKDPYNSARHRSETSL
jgi:6-phosphofructokinase 1